MKKKKRLPVVLVAIVACIGLCLLTPVGQPIVNGVRLGLGLYQKGVFERAPDRLYEGDTQANLKALYTAMMFAHDSDGQFPDSKTWMDAVQNRIKTGDMTAEEADKKLHDPSLGADPQKFGFAMNDACSGKYKGDLKDPKTVLLYVSGQTARNAHGDPIKDVGRSRSAITITGDVIKL